MLQFQLNIDEAKKTVLLDTFDLTINFHFFWPNNLGVAHGINMKFGTNMKFAHGINMKTNFDFIDFSIP